MHKHAKKSMVNSKALSYLHHRGMEADAFCPPRSCQPLFLPLAEGATEIRICPGETGAESLTDVFLREVKPVSCSLG